MTRVEVRLPKLGYDMVEGAIASWLKSPGDRVMRGEPIAEIDADKVTIEMEALVTGTLVEIVAEEGSEIAVGAVIAFVETDD